MNIFIREHIFTPLNFNLSRGNPTHIIYNAMGKHLETNHVSHKKKYASMPHVRENFSPNICCPLSEIINTHFFHSKT